MRIASLGAVALFVVVSCSSSGEAVSLPIGPIIATKGALDGVTRLAISVFDAAAVKCNDDPKSATRGQITGTAPALATKDLGSTNCTGGAKWCGDVPVEKSPNKRVISAEAFAGTTKRAAGCATITIDKDQIQAPITVYRVLPPATCGGKPSPYPSVQCDQPSNDFVCDGECLSKEMYLSKGTGAPGETSDNKDKLRPSFVWPASPDPGQGRFLAFFSDTSQSGRPQVGMRVLSPDLTACAGSACNPDRGPTVRDFSFFIPNETAGTIPSSTQGDMSTQGSPSGAYANNKYFVAFEDGGPSKIVLRSYGANFNCDQNPNMPLVVSTGNGQRPSIAPSGGKLLVVWQGSDGAIHARSVDASNNMLGAEQTISSGSGNTNATVAGTPGGWVVAWKSGADVKVRLVDMTGNGMGAETKVNDVTHMGSQESPAVAALADGRVAVVWIDTGNGGVFAQRYSASLAPVANDQAKRINDTTTDPCAQPTIAAGSSGADNFFVAAWVNTATSHVWGRFLDGAGGFLFNPVTGQAGEFQVSRDDGATRANPTAVVGGSKPYVAIGWEDNSGAASGAKCLGTITTGMGGTCKGIFARRLPVPTK